MYSVLFKIGGFDSGIFNSKGVGDFSSIIFVYDVIVMNEIVDDVESVMEWVFCFINDL